MSIEQFTVGDRVTYEVEGVTYAGVVSVVDPNRGSGGCVYVMPDWKTPSMRLLGLRWESVAFWGKRQARLQKGAALVNAAKWSRAWVQGKIVEKYTLETAPIGWDVRFYQGHPGHGSRGYIKVMMSVGPTEAENLTLETHVRGVDAEGAKELVMRLIELLQATKGSGFAVKRRVPKTK